ncbi:double-strand break repair helicase AddA [Stappia sp.]|uniref:double-strand break repair helicase AddA n=1 Tax=Stappia sp. TaxID=1870903 RepID=UPI003A9986D2
MSHIEVPQATRERQALAADPRRSAWVSANAGSGKTFVLSRRVIRLLLAGTAPSRILCLTFTKAAAAEMATRVFDTLGAWTALDDAALADEIAEIEGETPDAARLARARHLFATALETPGGLKIQTIHAFCEALLHQFPLEANVAGHFSVLDDRQAAELLATARAKVMGAAERDPQSPFGRALGFLISEMADKSVEEVLAELVSRRNDLRAWLVEAGSLQEGLRELRRGFGLDPDETLADVEWRMRGETVFDATRAAHYADLLATGGANDVARAQKLRAGIVAEDFSSWRATWLAAFFTAKLTPTKSLAGKAVASANPELAEDLAAEQARLERLLERWRAAYALAGTEAALRLADAMLDAYEGEKTRRGLMDFEDLIIRTANLLARSDAALWVQYKLDQGLDHILVDEAQDTSPQQWQVVRALAEEFFAGETSNPRLRTLFAVGDEKQSIYSFQGAVPAYFAEMRRHFARRAEEAERNFSRLELTLSFRSRPDVLSAVDLVFAEPAAHKGLSQDEGAPVHEAIRRNEPGMVEIWSPEQTETLAEPDDWTAPLDRLSAASPVSRLASRLAETIDAWWKRREADPGDVLVLVRKRGPFVDALTRALKQAGVPVAGSDRLLLNEHIAVADLVALGRFLLLPEDDLSLAAVLRGPLFGISEEQLFAIARPDPATRRSGTLWQSILRRSQDDPFWGAIRERIEDWRARADFMPPFEFYARLLGADGGRRAFRARLGNEVDDILDEFLALTLGFEQTGTPGLEGFLAWFAAAPTQVKRELNAARGVVRIMTVHGAKGLEAPLVVLVDGGGAPAPSQHDKPFVSYPRGETRAPALVWLPAAKDRTDWHAQAVDGLREAAEEEYRRLLYVAMTRAKDRLVVCGWAPARGQAEGCWHALVSAGLGPTARDGETATGAPCRIWQAQGRVTPPPLLGREAGSTAEDAGSGGGITPDWLSRPVAAVPRPRRLNPSTAFEEMETKDAPQAIAAVSRLEAARASAGWGVSAGGGVPASLALERGRHLHRLLQMLPDLPAAARRAAALRYLAAYLPEDLADAAATLAQEALGVLEAPEFAAVFDPTARAEVPIVGRIAAPDGTEVEVSGQIDRLSVTPEEVLLVDFKTDRLVPASQDAVGESYVTQLAVYSALLGGLYPGRVVRAALLFTAGPKLVELPAARLEAALAALSPA